MKEQVELSTASARHSSLLSCIQFLQLFQFVLQLAAEIVMYRDTN